MNKTKDNPKPKSDNKSAAEKNKSAETLDQHPKPVNNKAETSQMTADAVDMIDQHPRPVLRTAFVRELGMGKSLSAVSAAASPCTKSTINTTGSNKDENILVDSSGNKTYIGNFHKGLPHNAFGEVVPSAYQTLLTALITPTQANFAAITLGGERKLINPQSGLAKEFRSPYRLQIRRTTFSNNSKPSQKRKPFGERRFHQENTRFPPNQPATARPAESQT